MENIENIRHSLAHLLAAAVLKKFPDTKLAIGPAIDDGFYYDFLFTKPLTQENLPELEKIMRGLIAKKLEFSGKAVTAAEAKKLFSAGGGSAFGGNDQPFKLELIKEFAKDKKPLTIYSTGDVFTDLCRGGHVKNTGEINADAFKLTHLAGAYWRGNEKNPMLTRIYGAAFSTKAELDNYLKMAEEAKKNDHRKLGKELKIFALIDEVGPGLPLFYPKGAILRRIVENFITELQERRGYQPIWIPHITKDKLYKISGHLDKYDAMYPPMKLKDEADYYLKPMNCPHFMMLYKTELHSYRDLPIRWVSTTTNYRYEKSGELSGLTRVRALTQDDCHVFARPDQIESEINLMLDMVAEVYKVFRFHDFWVRISARDSKTPEKYIGDVKIWNESEATLKNLIAKRDWKYEVGLGEATFYGPKLDFIFKDALGRDWQLSTIQLDMNIPQRFELEYTDADGEKKRPVVIHRAILGSTERFLAILIEHFGGAFPVWLAPVQVRILPVSDKFVDYARGVKKVLEESFIRVEIPAADETLGKRIRNAELDKIPYIIVVGEKEMDKKTINVRSHKDGASRETELDSFLKDLREEIDEKR